MSRIRRVLLYLMIVIGIIEYSKYFELCEFCKSHIKIIVKCRKKMLHESKLNIINSP